MKKSILLIPVYFLILLGLLLQPSRGYAQDKSYAVSGGVHFNPIGYILVAEYERVLRDNMTVAARGGLFSYDVDYDEDGGTTNESGDGPGVEGVFRLYRGGKALEGFYLGGAFGIWKTDWEWTWTSSYADTQQGSGSSTAVDVNFTIGWKIYPGIIDRLYLDPTITAGNFFAGTHGKTGDSDEIGLYAAVGIMVGYVW